MKKAQPSAIGNQKPEKTHRPELVWGLASKVPKGPPELIAFMSLMNFKWTAEANEHGIHFPSRTNGTRS